MNLTYREISDWTFDYPLLSRWWGRHDRDVIPQKFLDCGFCFFSEEKSIPQMFSCVITGSKGGLCWLAWTMTNPDLRSYNSVRVIKDMVKFLDQWAADLGFGLIFTACNMPSYGGLFESEEFIPVEREVTTYMKRTGQETKKGVA